MSTAESAQSPADAQFWAFCVSVYGRPVVAEECLSLQERFGVNVLLLLLCGYVGAEWGALLPAESIAEADRAVRDWHVKVVTRLRELRRRLKDPGMHSQSLPTPSAELLRGEIKAAELASERIEAAMLAQWCDARRANWARVDRQMAVTRNLQALLANYGAGSSTAWPQHLASEALKDAPVTS